MAHEITSTDAFGYVGKKAWHGLGVELESDLSAEQAFNQLGLGWETELFPIRANMGEERINLPEHRAHIRMDTKQVLGVVGKDYRPISNREMAKFADALVGEDAAIQVETGGSLRGGKRVFVLVKLPRDTEVLDGDMLKNYICISNGHDGTNAFRVFYTPIRVVCANTLAMAEANVSGARFCHDGDVTKKIELARTALGILIKRNESFADQARTLAKVSLTKDQIGDYFDRVYGRTFGDQMSEKHTKDTLGLWTGNLSEARNTVRSTEGTAWHAMNAVTFWHDHQRGRFKSIHESDARIHSNLFGAAANAKQIALREATALV